MPCSTEHCRYDAVAWPSLGRVLRVLARLLLCAYADVCGRLVAPVSGRRQRLVTLRRGDLGLRRVEHEEVRFVPLISHAPDEPR